MVFRTFWSVIGHLNFPIPQKSLKKITIVCLESPFLNYRAVGALSFRAAYGVRISEMFDIHGFAYVFRGRLEVRSPP